LLAVFEEKCSKNQRIKSIIHTTSLSVPFLPQRQLADLTVGVGENWVGNLSNKELRDIFTLAN
jgi:hypothetical protein